MIQGHVYYRLISVSVLSTVQSILTQNFEKKSLLYAIQLSIVGATIFLKKFKQFFFDHENRI